VKYILISCIKLVFLFIIYHFRHSLCHYEWKNSWTRLPWILV